MNLQARLLVLVSILLCSNVGQANLAKDPLLTSDTHAGVIHAVEVCMDERSVEMFQKLRSFVITEPAEEELKMASEYYLIQFFNQYISDIDIDICDAIQRAVRTTRFRIGDKLFVTRPSMKARIEDLCRTHTFQISPTDYHSSLDKIPHCLRQMINHVMENVYGHL